MAGNKAKTLSVRLSAEESKHVEAQAEAAGQGKSDWARDRLLVEPSGDLDQLVLIERARSRILQAVARRPTAATHLAEIKAIMGGEQRGLFEALTELHQQGMVQLHAGEVGNSLDREHMTEVNGRRTALVSH